MSGFWHAVEASDAVARLGWTLLHSLWLGALTAALLAVAQRLLRRRSANARYLAACAALALLCASSAATFFLVSPRRAPEAPGQPLTAAAEYRPATPSAEPAMNVLVAPAGDPGEPFEPAARSATTTLPPPPLAATSVNSWDDLSTAVQPALPWLAVAWAGGVAALGLWRLSGWIAARRIRRSGRPAGGRLAETVSRLARTMKVAARVDVLESALVRVPALIGWLRPVILLPVGLASGLTPQQLEAILAHELAHVRRHDYLVNLLQSLAETLFFYHPAVWYIAGRIRAERENCCDDVAVTHGAEPVAYAESLLCVARRALAERGVLAAPMLGAVGRPSELRRRVRRLLGAADQPARAVRSWPAGLAVLGAIIGAAVVLHSGSKSNETRAADKEEKEPPAALKPPAWGKPVNGLRTRLSAASQVFRAGEAIPVRLEIENVADGPRDYQTPAAPHHRAIRVVDQRGLDVPYLDAPAQVMVTHQTLEAGQSREMKSFDLAEWYYLRRPGRYTAWWQGEITFRPLPDEARPRPESPPSGRFEFEVTPDPELAGADGDPIGRLLPLIRDKWSLGAATIRPGKLNPGANRAATTGRFVSLVYSPTPSKKDAGIVWLWLTDEPAAEQPVTADWPAPSEYLGKIARWHVYVHVDANAGKAWPAAVEDIKQALAGEPGRAAVPPQWGDSKDGLRARLSADKQTFRAGEPIPVTLEVQNVADEAKDCEAPAVLNNLVLSVVDERGREVPYLHGLIEDPQRPEKLESGQERRLKSFDLSEFFYLRRPGRYAARWSGGPAPAAIEFDVTADPVLAAADGDPVGRLLPLVKEQWWLSAGTSPRADANLPAEWNLGLHRRPVGDKDASLVWLELRNEPAEKPDINSSRPTFEYLGKVARWHAYIIVTADGQQEWPTARDDIRRVLAADAVRQQKLSMKLESDRDAFAAGEDVAIAMTIHNPGPAEVQAPETWWSARVVVDGKEHARLPEFTTAWNGPGVIIPNGDFRALFALSEYGVKPTDLGVGEHKISVRIGDEVSNELTVVVRAAADGRGAIPDGLKPYVQDYAAAGAALRAGFVPYKAQVVWGEPLEVTFTVDNLGPGDFEFMFGGDYRGTGRHDRFKIDVTDAAGKPLVDPHAGAPNFGGLASHEKLTPDGKVFQKSVDLTKFRTFEKPGEYDVTCSFAFDEPFTTKVGPDKPVVASRFRLTILERTPERVAAVLDELVAKARAAALEDLPASLDLLARFGGDDAAPRLIELTGAGPVERRAAAFAALPQASTEAAQDAAITALKDGSTADAIRTAAAGALGSMAKPRTVDALLAALPLTKPPVYDSILVALGNSKSPLALPVIVHRLERSNPKTKAAAVTALVANGSQPAIAALKEHVSFADPALRHQMVCALTDQLRQPLDTDWLHPILRTRGLGREWLDSLRLVRMYAGDRAAPTLLSYVDYDAPWSGRNWWILQQVQACPKAPPADYAHDPNREGTPDELEKNRRLLASLKELAGPVRVATPRRPRTPLPYLKTDPPIDFTPVLKPAEDWVDIKSGFLEAKIGRGFHQITYTPTEEYRPMYETAGRLREMLANAAAAEVGGVTAEQLEKLRALPTAPGHPDLTGCTQAYIAYKESPAGSLRQEAASELSDVVRGASQRYHAAIAAFVEAAQKIVAPVDRGGGGGGQQQARLRSRVERIHPTMVDNKIWLDLRDRLEKSGLDYRFVEVDEKGACRLSLATTATTDLAPLKGMPLEYLDLSHSAVKDLSPLEGMPLRSLDLSGTQVRDLSPLKGMKLTRLDMSSTGVTDLSPLADAPLTMLSATSTKIEDLSALARMPLTYLDIRNTAVKDLGPLAGTPLQTLQLEDTRVRDFRPLQKTPIGTLTLSGFEGVDLAQLKGVGLKKLTLTGAQFTDLAPLGGMKLEYFRLIDTGVDDLSPLADMPLGELALTGSPVKDLTPLKGMKLVRLYLSEPGIDLAPLAGMPLETIGLPDVGTVVNIDVLRDIKTLKWIRPPASKPLPAAEFWAGYDAARGNP